MTEPTRKLNTIIADDEPLARRLLRVLLSEIPEIELVGECRNGHEAVQATLELTPDLLVLDIQMPGLSGFDVIRELQPDVVPMVIFCTGYERDDIDAMDAFDLDAVDYLLKPIDEKDLQLAVARAMERLHGASDSTEHNSPHGAAKTGAAAPDRLFNERNQGARRQHVQLDFPITVNGTVIPEDRRKVPDRRLIAA